MTSAHAYDELHHLVDRLPPDQARRLLRLVRSDAELAEYADADADAGEAAEPTEPPRRRRLAITGIISGGPPDLAERHEDYLREYFNQSV